MLDYTVIGRKIRKYRKLAGLSQEALAEKVWISTTHMSHIETGSTKLSLPVLVDIAAVLDVRTDDLLIEPPADSDGGSADDISVLLESCSAQQVKVIYDIVKAAKMSMDKHISP